MVFFNCNACGEALKKNQVEKHYMTKCRQCSVLSCVDCGKDFWGDDYQQHTKCISEEEKYSGKDWKPKPNANKGEAKQEAWIHQLQSAIDKSQVNPRLQKLLEQLKDYPNVPRKKVKFENFVKNSLRVRDDRLVSEVWDILEKEAQEMYAKIQKEKEAAENAKKMADEETSSNGTNVSAEDTENTKNAKKEKKCKRKHEEQAISEEDSTRKSKKHKHKHGDDEDEDGQRKKSKKKRKREEDSHDIGTTNGEDCDVSVTAQDEDKSESTPGKFMWDAAIIGVLKRADDHEISVKKLRKKVLAEYHARGGDGKTKSEEKLWAKFTKKINKNPRLKIHKEKAKLVS